MTRNLRSVLLWLALVAACGRQSAPLAQNAPFASRQEGNAGSITTAGSCTEQYTIEALQRRAYAFDGTVKRIDHMDGSQDAGIDRVTFVVNTWFKGGGAPTAVRRGFGFSAETYAASAHQYGLRDRMLVAGDDDFVWECGFTQLYDDETAAEWAHAFDSS